MALSVGRVLDSGLVSCLAIGGICGDHALSANTGEFSRVQQKVANDAQEIKRLSEC